MKYPLQNIWLNLLFLALLLTGCREAEITPRPDYSAFLAETTPCFRGKINGVYFSYSSGSQWQQHNTYNTTAEHQLIKFGLTSEVDHITTFQLTCPGYYATSESEFDSIFIPGVQHFGPIHFFLDMNYKGNYYYSAYAPAGNEIEILKVHEFTRNGEPMLKVWFRIDTKLSTILGMNHVALTEGLMLAEFVGYKRW